MANSNNESKPREIRKSLPNNTKEVIIEYLRAHGATKSNTGDLIEAIGKKSYRALEDAFRYLEEVENILIQGKEGRATTWRLKNKELLSESLSQKDLVNFSYALESNKNEFDESTLKTIEKIFKTNKSFMSGYLAPFEEFDDSKINGHYKALVKAIKERLYLTLIFNYDTVGRYENVKPIQIVFIDNNWYIAFEYLENKKKKFIFRRLVFIKKIQYLKENSYSNKKTFQTKDIEKYQEFIENAQNAMTLFDGESNVATLKATPAIAKYFAEGMKKFLPSQTFKGKEEDGSVIFTLEYTQDLEILPFIQKWLPDLIIVEPLELKKAYRKKLKLSLKNYTN